MGIDTEQKGRIMAGSTARGIKSKSQTDKSQMEDRGWGVRFSRQPVRNRISLGIFEGQPVRQPVSNPSGNPSGSAKEVFSFQYLSGKPEERQAYREKTS
jgi:hypothetical protein